MSGVHHGAVDPARMTVEELKRELRRAGKTVTGNKTALVARLLETTRGAAKVEYTPRELRVKEILEATGVVGASGRVRTRKQFDKVIGGMGGMEEVLGVFGGRV